jgi:Ca-activated chloride channel homolog
MSFESPWLLLALPLLAVAAGIWLLAERRRIRYAVAYTNLDVLASVVSGRSWLRILPPALFGLALASLLVALARPHVERTFLKERATVILVIDTSRSMQAEDVPPTRLAAAQEAVRMFLDQVPDRLQVGLVVFAGEAQVATPPTRDHDLVRTAVDEIDSFLVYGGTAIGDALEAAVELGKQVEDSQAPDGQEIAFEPKGETRTLAQATQESEEEAGPVSILFLSDGAQTRGILQPLEGAALAKEARFPVYTVADRSGSAGLTSGSLCRPTRRRCSRSPRSPAESSPRPGRSRGSRRRTRTWARSSAASRARARSPSSSSAPRRFCSSSLGSSPRSSPRGCRSGRYTATIVKGWSAGSSRPAGCTVSLNKPAPRMSTFA